MSKNGFSLREMVRVAWSAPVRRPGAGVFLWGGIFLLGILSGCGVVWAVVRFLMPDDSFVVVGSTKAPFGAAVCWGALITALVFVAVRFGRADWRKTAALTLATVVVVFVLLVIRKASIAISIQFDRSFDSGPAAVVSMRALAARGIALTGVGVHAVLTVVVFGWRACKRVLL